MIGTRERTLAGRLKGKVALVTAAGQGIGRAIAEAFIAEGAIVIATDVDEAKLKGLKAKQRLELDVRKPKEIEALARSIAKEFGGLDVLANVAGVVHHGSVLDATDAEWDFAFDLNVRSMHRTIQAFLPGMVKKGGGAIVNMSSAASSIRGVPNRYVYGTTKAAVIGLTKSIAMDFIKQGVRVNAICPGTIEVAVVPRPRRGAFQAQRQVAEGRLAGFHRPPADGPHRHRRGGGAARGLSRLRRIQVHLRPHPPDRRRLGPVA